MSYSYGMAISLIAERVFGTIQLIFAAQDHPPRTATAFERGPARLEQIRELLAFVVRLFQRHGIGFSAFGGTARFSSTKTTKLTRALFRNAAKHPLNFYGLCSYRSASVCII